MDVFKRDAHPLRRWLSASVARQEFGLLLVFLGVAALFLAFGLLAAEVMEGDTAAFDKAILVFFRQPRDMANTIGPLWLKEAARDLTALGSTVVLSFVFVAVLGYLIMLRKRAAALLILGAVSGGQLISTLLKLSFERARPDLVPNAPHVFTASFPSGHTMLSAITYLTLAALLARVEPRRSVRNSCAASLASIRRAFLMFVQGGSLTPTGWLLTNVA
ncbi:phosphatase PAP2 family protein [uncultured Bradyrhizobium sp.]|uniref:phosphatase PAP2 family protein n=1 Tax=uncultured Bradyrhizobium sp. TaxID=199684 RepID=UPI00262FD8E1|nr:phosphatase PAP2 family protein [uncultured Bradyrhizobium sp.]